MDILDKQMGLIEAVLFLEDEPVSQEHLVKITNLTKKEVVSALERLKQAYKADIHGLEIVKLGGGYLFSPKKELWELLKPRYGKRNENRLSKASLETMAIIAYSQPITRSEIESIRGVSPDAMIKLLLSKNLIKEVGKKDVLGKPVQYGTTKEFLMYFKLSSISDLPKLNEIDNQRFKVR